MKLHKIGEWSEIKLDIIKEYANAFTRIMKKQDWCKEYLTDANKTNSSKL